MQSRQPACPHLDLAQLEAIMVVADTRAGLGPRVGAPSMACPGGRWVKVSSRSRAQVAYLKTSHLMDSTLHAGLRLDVDAERGGRAGA